MPTKMHVDAVSTVVAATFLDQGVEWLNDYGGMLEELNGQTSVENTLC